MEQAAILVIDDDRNILEVMQMRLEIMGYRVVTCADPREALSLYDRDSFSAVVTDQRMEGVRGSELIAEFHRRDPHLPVIIMTAFGTVRDAIDAVHQGAFTYLQKPIDTEELRRHLAQALERRSLEKSLARERKTWMRVLESMGAGLILINPDLTVAWMNPVAEEMLNGGTPLLGKSCKNLFSAELVTRDECPVEKALSSGAVQSLEFQDPKTGRWFLITVTPVKDTDGKVVQAAELIMDISELKGAQEAILEQERLKGALEMAGAAAHELSQPMQAILGWGELLQRRIKDDDPDLSILKSICQQIEKLGSITKKISTVTYYVTKDYPGTSRIIDLHQDNPGTSVKPTANVYRQIRKARG